MTSLASMVDSIVIGTFTIGPFRLSMSNSCPNGRFHAFPPQRRLHKASFEGEEREKYCLHPTGGMESKKRVKL